MMRAVTKPINSSRSTAAHDTMSRPFTTFWKNSDSYLIQITQDSCVSAVNQTNRDRMYLMGKRSLWIFSRVARSEGQIGLYEMSGLAAIGPSSKDLIFRHSFSFHLCHITQKRPFTPNLAYCTFRTYIYMSILIPQLWLPYANHSLCFPIPDQKPLTPIKYY